MKEMNVLDRVRVTASLVFESGPYQLPQAEWFCPLGLP